MITAMPPPVLHDSSRDEPVAPRPRDTIVDCETVTYAPPEDENVAIVRGTNGDDVLRGGEGDDLLFGEDGEDAVRAYFAEMP